MTQIPALPFERSDDDRVVAGVCGGLASTLEVDATLVRLVFALLALAGGAGILLYFALWAYAGRQARVGRRAARRRRGGGAPLRPRPVGRRRPRRRADRRRRSP